MRVMQGRSQAAIAADAVSEALADFDTAPEIVFVFASTVQDPGGVVDALESRFPGVPIAGCTTAGEQLGGVHATGSLVVLGVVESGVQWAVEQIQGLGDQTDDSLGKVASKLFEGAGIDPEELEPDKAVCMLFIDGLQGAEERISAALADALEGVRLAGGSAGDDLKFEKTHVFGPEGALSDAATLVMARSTDGTPIRVLKHQHFTSTPTSLVVTKAEGRVVHEFDGLPAIEAYAEALGLQPSEVTGEVTFMNPVTFACNGELYVRSIHSVADDGSIAFYCAVEEGMVLEIGGHADMCDALKGDLVDGFAGAPELVVGFNCILRALEATGKELHDDLGKLFDEQIPGLVGFDTYGEQLNRLHINQTLVAVGFGRASA